MQRLYQDQAVRLRDRLWRIRDSGGPGHPLFLMPGGLGNADIFYNQMLDLTPAIRCIAVDYPDTDHESVADGLAALMDLLGLQSANMLGSSLGGYWLQFFGVRYPERVSAMMLANSFSHSCELRMHPLFSEPVLRDIDGEALKSEWLARLEARDADELREVQIALLREGQTGDLLRRRLLAAATAPDAPVIPHGQFPIFLLDCEDDPLLPANTRNALVERYPAARHVRLPSGGHYPSVTQTDLYNDFISDAVSAD